MCNGKWWPFDAASRFRTVRKIPWKYFWTFVRRTLLLPAKWISVYFCAICTFWLCKITWLSLTISQYCLAGNSMSCFFLKTIWYASSTRPLLISHRGDSFMNLFQNEHEINTIQMQYIQREFTYNHITTNIMAGMVRDSCSSRHVCIKWADSASNIKPTGYEIVNAMLIHDLWTTPIFSVTVE